MKTLLVIRHAKSSWKDSSLSDLQRPLKNRGVNDARDMAGRVQALDTDIQRVLYSPARRAEETLDLMCEIIPHWQETRECVTDLYGFDYEDLMATLRKTDDRWHRVAMVGHNPGITDLVNFLALENLRNIPTCGIALMELDIGHWRDLKAGCATLAHYDYPKSREDA